MVAKLGGLPNSIASSIRFGERARRQQGIYRLEDESSSCKKQSSCVSVVTLADEEEAAEGNGAGGGETAKIGAKASRRPSIGGERSAAKGMEEEGTSCECRIGKVTFWLKYLSLLVLILQTAAHVLFVRYATTRKYAPPFLKTVVVFYNEVIKLAVALLLYFLLTAGSPRKSLVRLYEHFFVRWLDTLKLGVPAIAYTVQTFLLYVALEHLDAGTYSVTYQLKILTTAFFTVLIMHRRLSLAQWLALFILVAGVATVQISAEQAKSATTTTTDTKAAPTNLSRLIAEKNELLQNSPMLMGGQENWTALAAAAKGEGEKAERSMKRGDESGTLVHLLLAELRQNATAAAAEGDVSGGRRAAKASRSAAEAEKWTSQQQKNNSSSNNSSSVEHFDEHKQNPITGLLAVLAACFLSGFSGVYIEKLLKRSKDVSVWLQNVQLSALAIPISLVVVAVQDWQKMTDKGFNQGFDSVVWGVVLLQSFGGLITAVVIKYADNILKAFANSFSIICISIASVFLFQQRPKLLFALGAALVIGSVIIYSLFPYRAGITTSSTTTTLATDGEEKAQKGQQKKNKTKKSDERDVETGGAVSRREEDHGGGLPTKENVEERLQATQ